MLRSIFALCACLFFSLTNAYAYYNTSDCEYHRSFQIMKAMPDPQHPRDLVIETHVNDGMGTGFVYFGTSGTRGKTVRIYASCWESHYSLWNPYVYVKPTMKTHNGDESEGAVQFTVGSNYDPYDDVDVIVSVRKPFLRDFRTSAVQIPNLNSNYRLLPMKDIVGNDGPLPLIFMPMMR